MDCGKLLDSLKQCLLFSSILIFTIIYNFTYTWTGYLDNVKCFFCDGGLCNWEADDDPWTEHARWFPECGFLKQVKGTTFIQEVRVGLESHMLFFIHKTHWHHKNVAISIDILRNIALF